MEKLKCSTNGILRGGKAACGYVIVGDKTCSLKPGECNLQAGAEPGKANGVLADSGILDGSNRTTGGWIGQP